MQSGVVSAVGGPQGLPLLAESVRQPREPTSAVGFPCGGGVQVPVRGPGRKPAHSKSGNDGNGSPQTLPVFLFLEKVSGDRLLALPVRPPVLLRVLVGSVAAVGSHKPRRRSGPAPAQSDGAGVGGAESGPATFPDPGGRSREAQRTGFSPWKRSFCASGRDRDRTVSCRWSPAPRFDCAYRPRRTAATKLAHGMVRWIDGKVKRKLAQGIVRWSRWKGQTARFLIFVGDPAL